MSSLKLVAYGSSVLTLEDVKRYLRLETTSDHDERLSDLIPVAETVIEDRTGRAIRQNEYSFSVGHVAWSGLVRLPRPPVLTVSAVTAYDSGGTPVPVSYAVIPHGELGAVIVDAESIPSSVPTGSPVSIDFSAGYEPAAVPPSLLQAMRLLVGHYFEHTEAATDSAGGGGVASLIPEGVEQLVLPYVVLSISG